MISNFLVNNYTDGTLHFKKYPPEKEEECFTEVVSTVIRVVINAALYPALAVGATFYLAYQAYTLVTAKWDQSKLVTIIKDDSLLEKYAKAKKQANDEDIQQLKLFAVDVLKRMEPSVKADLNLPDIVAAEIKKDDQNFPREKFAAFLMNDFFTKGLDENCRTLQALRITLKTLISQNALLVGPESPERLESIKRVAEFHFVQSKVDQHMALAQMKKWVWLFIPCGTFAIAQDNARLLLSNRKEDFAEMTSLQSFKGLRAAHNKLVTANPFLNPRFQNELMFLNTHVGVVE